MRYLATYRHRDNDCLGIAAERERSKTAMDILQSHRAMSCVQVSKPSIHARPADNFCEIRSIVSTMFSNSIESGSESNKAK